MKYGTWGTGHGWKSGVVRVMDMTCLYWEPANAQPVAVLAACLLRLCFNVITMNLTI